MRVRELHELLEQAGAVFIRRARHCYLYRMPDGRIVSLSSTPSDTRARRRMLADLRRAGIDVRGVR